MEKNILCKYHSKTIQMICKDCRDLVCYKCVSEHRKKGCSNVFPLLSYAEEEMLPLCKARLEHFKRNTQDVADAAQSLLALSKTIKPNLIKLRGKLEESVSIIGESIELLGGSEGELLASKESIERSLVLQYEELKDEIEKENVDYVVRRIGQPLQPDISDSEKSLIDALSESIRSLEEMKDLSLLNSLLKDFNKSFKLPANASADAGKLIYGVCSPQANSKVLCGYSTQTGKLATLVAVPQSCSVAQTRRHILVSGGYNPYTNVASEFEEQSKQLVSRAPMRYSKCYHALQVVSEEVVVAVGGFSGEEMGCCEEYLITEDEWRAVPSLSKKRARPATVFLNNCLYAIGGHSNNSIEVLNFTEKKSWTPINLEDNEANFNDSPAAMPISDNEILILCGGRTSNTGVFNIKGKAVKKTPFSSVSDYYTTNAVAMANGKAYVLGCNGHMHIYDVGAKQLKELLYSDICP